MTSWPFPFGAAIFFCPPSPLVHYFYWVKRTILLYGLLLAVLMGVLHFLEYKYLVHDLSMEFYLSAIALLFMGLGVWTGLKWTKGKKEPQENFTEKPVFSPPSNLSDLLKSHSITQREFEVLQLMEKGHSNQEIADALFVSLNTVKSHSSNLFAKLDVKRRTQAVQKAKEIGLF